ncbi:MAG: DUF808 family protein [Rhizobiales bacterium]|jgi:predicted DNA repair protein MutK|nr:DUF808 family protein [Hyphomicrobiales bacterium]
MHKFRRDVDHKFQVLVQSVSPGLVTGMPVLLRVLSMVGTAAMLSVSGGLFVHVLATSV